MRYLLITVTLGLASTIATTAGGAGPHPTGIAATAGTSWHRVHGSHVTDSSAHGWTIRGEHFAVLATTSRDDAVRVAEELERTWTDISRVADQWTDVHRRPEFGRQAVSVVLSSQQRHPRSQTAAGLQTPNAQPEIHLNLADGTATLEDRLPQLRAATFSAFVDLTGQGFLLPPWVQSGMAAYFSGAPLPSPTSLLHLDLPEAFAPPTKGSWARHSFNNRGYATADGEKQTLEAAYWVRYLLEGDDAVHAYPFFDALATAVAKGSRDDLSSTQKARSVEPKVTAAPPQHPVDLDRLLRETARAQEVSDWLADPNVGQPVVTPDPAELALDERHLEMVLILKLARRFASDHEAAAGPKVYEQGVQLVEEAPSAARAWDFAAFSQRLSGPDQPRWATIDIDGRLLLSSDKQRLEAIFTRSDLSYRMEPQEGRLVLEATFATGEVYQAWLEENPAQPKRPTAHLRLKPAPAPQAEQTSSLREIPSGGSNRMPRHPNGF